MTTQKTINKYMKILHSGKFEEQEIISFRSLLNNGCDYETKTALLDMFDENAPFKLSQAQQDKGINWLRNFFFTKSGAYRNNQQTNKLRESLGEADYDTIIEIVNDYCGFNFHSLHEDHNGYTSFYFPVYRCVSNANDYFDYVCKLGSIHVIEIDVAV